MNKLMILGALFGGFFVNAQNYQIEFAGSGAATTINTVKVENLTSELSLTLNGSDILLLSIETDINIIENAHLSEIKVYPNPITDNFIVQISPPKAGNAILSLYDLSGKLVSQTTYYLEKDLQEFHFSGVNNGLYLLNIIGNSYQFSTKLLSNNKSNLNNSIKIAHINYAFGNENSTTNIKNQLATIEMPYSDGDRLMITASSGIYSTVVTDIPTEDKLITFNFIACTDGDGNNYPVVEIGEQIWMAENLKTTKYRDGNEIQNITDVNSWSGLSTGAYCWYNNESTNKNVYGGLYNWFAVDDSHKLCPSGWHIPTTDEYLILIESEYLGQSNIAGGKLKETGTAHWSNPNSGATNEFGFTALPAGRCYSAFKDIGNNGRWWTAVEYNSLNAYAYGMQYDNVIVYNILGGKANGFSVRCVKD